MRLHPISVLCGNHITHGHTLLQIFITFSVVSIHIHAASVISVLVPNNLSDAAITVHPGSVTVKISLISHPAKISLPSINKCITFKMS